VKTASEMTYIVSGGALNSTHSLTYKVLACRRCNFVISVLSSTKVWDPWGWLAGVQRRVGVQQDSESVGSGLENQSCQQQLWGWPLH